MLVGCFSPSGGMFLSWGGRKFEPFFDGFCVKMSFLWKRWRNRESGRVGLALIFEVSHLLIRWLVGLLNVEMLLWKETKMVPLSLLCFWGFTRNSTYSVSFCRRGMYILRCLCFITCESDPND